MGNELVVANGKALALTTEFTDDQIGLLKRTICKDSTDDELSLFIGQCKRMKLDPFAKQIHAVKRWDAKAGRNVMSIQTGIDGYRLIAERTGNYEGQTSVMWCGADGAWKDVWLEKDAPKAAKVGIYKTNFKEPVYAVALWDEYVQQHQKDGRWNLSPMWAKMGSLMIAKCAEALALRKAFPQELSGVYTMEEMGQADNAQPVQELPPIDPKQLEFEKNWKKWRGKFNQGLLKCSTMEELVAKRKSWEELMKMGAEIWPQRTFHNEKETFQSLYDTHHARIQSAVDATGPAAVKLWLAGLDAVTSVSGLAGFVKSFRTDKRFDTQECEEALHEKACYLGLGSYTEVEEEV